MNKKIIAVVVVAVVVFAGVGYWLAQHNKKESPVPSADDGATRQAGGEENFEDTAVNYTESSPSNPERLLYVNNDFGFSFELPKEYTVTNFSEDTGEMILAQGMAQSGGKTPSFQVFIAEFDEEGPITPARIKQDLPDTYIEGPQNVLIGPEKNIPALIYYGKSESLGRTREVWFVAGGFVYQLTAYADMDGIIVPTLDSWKFQ